MQKWQILTSLHPEPFKQYMQISSFAGRNVKVNHSKVSYIAIWENHVAIPVIRNPNNLFCVLQRLLYLLATILLYSNGDNGILTLSLTPTHTSHP